MFFSYLQQSIYYQVINRSNLFDKNHNFVYVQFDLKIEIYQLKISGHCNMSIWLQVA